MGKLLDTYRSCSLTASVAAEIDAVAAELEGVEGCSDERRWLSDARARMEPFIQSWPTLEDEVLALPDLAALRAKRFKTRREVFSTAVEHLHEALLEHAGPISPLAEFLFRDIKFHVIGRAKAAALQQVWTDLEKRLNSSYAIRLMTEEKRYEAIAQPAEAVKAAGASLLLYIVEPQPIGVKAQTALVTRLVEFRDRSRIPTRQAQALLEAARAVLPEPETTSL
ncbi:MAG: hypothetical protein AAF449_04460 [Myxococcota bacterium]